MSSGGASESAPWGYIAAINAATDTRTFRATNTTPISATTAPPTRWPGKVDGQEEVGGGWRNFYFLFSGEKKWPKKEVCRQKWKASKSAKLFRGGGFDIISLGCWAEGGAWWVVGGGWWWSAVARLQSEGLRIYARSTRGPKERGTRFGGAGK